jgi:hypothetical protein
MEDELVEYEPGTTFTGVVGPGNPRQRDYELLNQRRDLTEIAGYRVVNAGGT